MPFKLEHPCDPIEDPTNVYEYVFPEWRFSIRLVCIPEDMKFLADWEPDYVDAQSAASATEEHYKQSLQSGDSQSFLCFINEQPVLAVDVYKPDLYRKAYNLPNSLDGYGVDFRFPKNENAGLDKLIFSFSGFLEFLWTFPEVNHVFYRFDHYVETIPKIVVKNGLAYITDIPADPVKITIKGVTAKHIPTPFALYGIARDGTPIKVTRL
jgi:hypothetical protein